MRRLCFYISTDLDAGLKALKAQYGTPDAETIRRALTVYLTEKGVLKEGASKAPRKKRPPKS
jgi:hypothetical protein